IEDVDQTRTVPGAAESMVAQLQAFGMEADGEIVWQSRRDDLYAVAFDKLQEHVFACGCTRSEIADSISGSVAGSVTDAAGMATAAAIYPGTCRAGLAAGRAARTWRVQVPYAGEANDAIGFHDRACGWQSQILSREVGDFVLRRADGFWAYQLAVVVDDAAQGVTHVVRGMDLLDSTPRQIYLQQLLGLSTPTYLHVPLVCNAQGEKLSKQTGAMPLDPNRPLPSLLAAARVLGLKMGRIDSLEEFWVRALALWQRKLQSEPGDMGLDQA
ncbi:MAG: tRNA glutamyl-Q(34) synthetase GluQRS, partial [Sphingomonadaceae bacterium]|nr:tRNA glutamyl-Q(34) synthetase GluQRS [Sphingomonadaceae bacterium]